MYQNVKTDLQIAVLQVTFTFFPDRFVFSNFPATNTFL